jgi:dTDP-4-dehydrorhamnose 3,5-epimerase
MLLTKTKITGVFIVDLERRRDDRGFFARQWCADEFSSAGLDPRLAQVNTARSVSVGTLRGLHYQKAPHAEVKLVRCTRGAVFDVAVDLRVGSPTFCQWVGIELNEESGRMLYIPEGCAHGYLTLVPNCDLVYQASVPYAPESAAGARHDDPAFKIEWPGPINMISPQDLNWPSFSASAPEAVT